ncbi:unnamed protein product [Cuscuta campestris]|uniref:Uncharacterized protein n=1 Tax=Cuscuta campestris TaxID=132261 RepID=A0A484NR17_9ASTE|nr:unnamed protein product [Cuscuta campestris]
MESSPTLEEQLMEAGNKLLKPPSSIEELLPLLDEAVSFLKKVQQSPAKSVLASLSPLIKALVEDALLRNSNLDAKVALASCLSEITRITAPSVPYGDEKMRSVFELIVSSFENLHDETSRSFKNRAMILKTVCEVPLWVVMLDLKCDELISRMFQYFIKSVRGHHPYYIFSSMESIMTAVLEESDDVSVVLITSLLASVRKENEEIKEIGKRLAGCALRNCAFRLKPYVTCAIKSLSLSLDDYSRFVTSVLQVSPIFFEHNSDTSNGRLCAERQFASSSFGKMVRALGNKAPTVSSDVLRQRSEDANQEDPPDNNPGSQVSKRDGHCLLAEYSTEEQKAKDGGITNFPTDDTPVEAAKQFEENGSGGLLFLHKNPENEAVTVSLPDPSHTVRDSLVQMTIQPKEDDSLVQNRKEPLSAAIASNMPCEETYDLISRDPGTNVRADTFLEEESWSMRDAKVKGLKEQGEKTKANERNGVSSRKTSDSESLPQNPRTREQRESSIEEEAGSIRDAVVEGLKQQVGKTQSQHGRASTEIDGSQSSAKDDNNRLLFSEIHSMKSAGDVCNEGNQSKSTKTKHT